MIADLEPDVDSSAKNAASATQRCSPSLKTAPTAALGFGTTHPEPGGSRLGLLLLELDSQGADAKSIDFLCELRTQSIRNESLCQRTGFLRDGTSIRRSGRGPIKKLLLARDFRFNVRDDGGKPGTSL